MRRFEGSTFCHLAGWRNVMDGLGHETFWWVAMSDEGALQGLLPLVRVASRLFGDYLLSMPFVSYGGPIGSAHAKEVLTRKAVEEAQRLGVDLLELRARTPLPGGLPVSRRKLAVLKSLPASSEELWESGIRSKVRSQIRRPIKEGLETRFGPHLIEPFYDVFSRTMRDLGTPVLPKSFFRDLGNHLTGQVVFGVVFQESTPLAAGCGFAWNGELEVTWAGARREWSKLAPNMLLYWSLMEESVRRGAHTFNFGRCTPGSSTHKFKQQWGATEEQPLPWTQWSSGGVSETPNPDAAKFRLAPRVWRRLPVKLANRIGPMIARSLP